MRVILPGRKILPQYVCVVSWCFPMWNVKSCESWCQITSINIMICRLFMSFNYTFKWFKWWMIWWFFDKWIQNTNMSLHIEFYFVKKHQHEYIVTIILIWIYQEPVYSECSKVLYVWNKSSHKFKFLSKIISFSNIIY